MLIETDTRTVTGSLSDLLTILYSTLYVELVETGMPSADADALVLRILPRIEQRLVRHGFVTRQVSDA